MVEKKDVATPNGGHNLPLIDRPGRPGKEFH
jgi:hypothetical protein